MSTISIVIADDHAVMRSGLKMLLEAEDDLEVVAEAGDVEETIRKLKAYKPSVLLLDLHMPGGPSLQFIPEMREASPATRIVVLTMQNSAGYVREALRAGALGYVTKEAADAELVEAVRLAANDEPYLHPRLGARLATEPVDEGPPDDLTEREVQVLRLIALGHTNTEIASQLFLSVRTVESHRAHIQQKLRLSSRAELVRYALAHGLAEGELETLDRHRLTQLIEAGRTLVSELDLEVVLERLLEVAAEMTEARYVAMDVLDPSKTNLERFLTRGIGPEQHAAIGDLPRGRGVLGLLITDPRPLRMSHVGAHPESYGFPPGHPPMDSFLGVPVRIRGEVYGNLYLTEKAGGRDFTEEDERSIVILADWAAIAIDNARLYQNAEDRRQDLERAVRGLEVTTAIARAVGGETDIDRVLELIVKRARALVRARGLLIMLVEGDDLVVAATAGELPADIHGQRVPVAGTVASEVLRSAKPERVSNVSAERVPATVLLGIEARTALIVPLVFRSQTVGVLTAIDRVAEGPEFNDEDEELMLSFAASAATAVHTARSVGEERLRLAIEGAELERQRWARELHDETLQGLGGLQMLLSSALRQRDPERRDSAVRSTLEHIGREIDNLRNLITELRPAELDELGLESAVEALVHRRETQSGMKVVSEIDLGTGYGGAPRRIDPAVESTLYRLVQEALTNAAKHAHAERVDIKLAGITGAVELIVKDNGKGFDPSAATSGFGLMGMRERVALVRGTFEVDSGPDSGTTLRVVLPIGESAETSVVAA